MDLNAHIFEPELVDGEFQLISLGLSSHKTDIAVSIVNNWIFHPNFSNALKLNQYNLDICRGKPLYQVRKGYLFRLKQFRAVENMQKRIYKPASDPFFDTLTKALSYVGFKTEAEKLNTYKMDFQMKIAETKHFVMNSIIHFIWNDDDFRSFRRMYEWKEVHNNLNLLDAKMNDGEFFWIHSCNKCGKPSSVLTVVNDTIFCNSSENAMELNQCNTNLICGVGENNIIRIRKAYIFKKKQSLKRKLIQIYDDDFTLL
jgi:hypothetical protein